MLSGLQKDELLLLFSTIEHAFFFGANANFSFTLHDNTTNFWRLDIIIISSD